MGPCRTDWIRKSKPVTVLRVAEGLEPAPVSTRVSVHDAREASTFLASALGDGMTDPRLTATITSPPYGALLDYGVPGQIGHGQDTDAYLADCASVFRQLHEWTVDHGSLWLIVDSYTEAATADRPSRMRALPFELANIAEQAGWTLKDVIVWRKDRTLPWSHRGRLRNAFEHVVVLAKSDKFTLRTDRLRDNGELSLWWVRYPERYHPMGRAPDNVWDIPIPVQGSWGRRQYQHACPLPPELVRRVVLLASDPGDVIFDPFAGLGTVPAVAEALGRVGLGTELNPTFVDAFQKHVRREIGMQAASARDSNIGPTPELIKTLRALKYPKTLLARARSAFPELPAPDLAIGMIQLPQDPATDREDRSVVSASWSFVVADDTLAKREKLQTAMKELAQQRPLSKFGVAADLRVVDQEEAQRILGHAPWQAYEHGQTWNTSRTVTGVEALEIPRSPRSGKFAPIVADLSVSVDLDSVGDPAASGT